MKSQSNKAELLSEVMIMPDGKIYAHNLTPEMAKVLSELNPADESIKQRVITHVNAETKKLLPADWDETQLKP
jgi:hypothetical protein